MSALSNLLVIISVGLVTSLYVETHVYSADLIKRVSLSCSTKDTEYRAEEITFYGPNNNNNNSAPFAIVQANESATTIKNSFKNSNMKVVGEIDATDPKSSFLTVMFMPLMEIDLGTYTCQAYYIDKHGRPNTETATIDLQNKPASLELILKYSISRINKLDTDSKKKDQEIAEQEKRLQTLNSSLVVLKNKVNYRCAFTAMYKTTLKFGRRKTVKFQTIKLNDGGNYDVDTGIFKAPKKGVYSMSLTISSSDEDDYIKMYLYHNDDEIAAVWCSDDDSSDQSSITVLVKMNKNDTVKPVTGPMKKAKGTLEDNPEYSIFSGHLLYEV